MEIRKYELLFWLTSNLNESEAEVVFNEITKKIESFGGQIINTQIPQLKPLSYKIKKETNGYFGFIHFSGGEDKLSDLQKETQLNDKILRFVITRIRDSKQRSKRREIKHPSVFKSRQISHQEKTTVLSSQNGPVHPVGGHTREEMSLEELDKKLNEILKE
ncbi:MAG: 30S ribosomal protein S6 [Candidatus Paceibacterota bacterium]|jgi:small subunit ribosomal protein S6